jgi:arsenate reductase-like glutaredoxin family protein
MTSNQIPEEFTKVLKDFIRDLKTTFPEYEPFISKWWKDKEHFSNISHEDDRMQAYEKAHDKSVKLLFSFCQKKFPPRFFDILYQNADIFKEDSDIDTEFLPKIHFKNLWQCDISDKTKETIWKYLQLIMFSIVGTLENKEAFGDTAKLFEAINDDEFKSKLEETLRNMQGIFDGSGNFANAEGVPEGINMENIPNAETIQDHISGMLEGKIGQLAREIAEDAAANLDIDFDDATDVKGVFQKLMKNPTKLMGLVKNVGSKLDSKMKSGELKESELIAEATEIMNKMKGMPGMDNIQSMLGKMGLNGMGGMGGKMNMGAMESQLNKRMQMAKNKERMKAKVEANALKKAQQEKQVDVQVENVNVKPVSEEELAKLFSSSEKAERTPRGKKKGKK